MNPPRSWTAIGGREVMELFRWMAHELGAAIVAVTHDPRTLGLFDTVFETEDGVLALARPAA